MKLNLEGKLAFISGSSRGIGKAIALSLASEGVHIGLNGRKPLDLSITSKEISEKYPNVVIKHFLGDVKNSRYLDLRDFDILINNVGGGGTWTKEGDKVMDMNYGNMRRMIELYLEKERDWGRVITISSIYGKEKHDSAVFSATKSAQIAYMKSLAGKYEGITFNTICPGFINTKEDIIGYANDNEAPIGTPEDIANMVTFLCSDRSSFINGACIVIDGGFTKSF